MKSGKMNKIFSLIMVLTLCGALLISCKPNNGEEGKNTEQNPPAGSTEEQNPSDEKAESKPGDSDEKNNNDQWKENVDFVGGWTDN